MNAQRYPDFTTLSPEILRPRLPRIGQIKIGAKGRLMKSRKGKEFRPPVKLSHFLVTKRTRDATENYIRDDSIHAKIGDAPTELDVMLMFNDPAENWQTSLVAYDGQTLACQGNGVEAFDRTLNAKIPCTCPLLKQHVGEYAGPTRPVGRMVCKPSGVLSVLLLSADTYGGFYTFRTTSWESISSITAALEKFKSDFGVLAYLPMRLVVYPSTDRYEEKGKTKTSTSYKVGLVLAGGIDTAMQIAADRQERRNHLLQLSSGTATYTAEEHAEQLREIAREDESDVADEFHPEAVIHSAGNATVVEADYEIEEEEEDEVATDEDGFPLEQICRRTMELAGFDRIRTNNALAKTSVVEVAMELEAKRPEQWAQARAELAEAIAEQIAAEAGAAREADETAEDVAGSVTEPKAATADSGTVLDLFGGG